MLRRMDIRNSIYGEPLDYDRFKYVLVYIGLKGRVIVLGYDSHGEHPADPGAERWVSEPFATVSDAMKAAREWAAAHGLDVINVVKNYPNA